jgi:hypothetical protein
MATQITGRLDESVKTYIAAQGLLLTSTLGDTMYVSMKNYNKLQIIIAIADGTTVTGSAITLKQASDVAATGEKPLAFTRSLQNRDWAAGKVMTETAITANTFTTVNGSNSKIQLYILDVDSSTLDTAGGFDCVRVDGTAHASTSPLGSVVIYNLYNPRYSDANALID